MRRKLQSKFPLVDIYIYIYKLIVEIDNFYYALKMVCIDGNVEYCIVKYPDYELFPIIQFKTNNSVFYLNPEDYLILVQYIYIYILYICIHIYI